jgi:ATPase family associated with various cellular activities (AAA)
MTTRRAAAKRKPQAHKETPSAIVEATEPEVALAWFRLLARARGAWIQHLWFSEGSTDGRATVTHADFAAILADLDSPEAEAAWEHGEKQVREWRTEAQKLARAADAQPDSRFARCARVFGLNAEELELLRLCAAVAFDPALARVCAYLQDHSGRAYLTEDLATRLLGLGRASVWPPEMNVFRWELIQRRETGPGEPAALVCDPQIRDWLAGRRTLDETLLAGTRVIEPAAVDLPEWPVEDVAEWIDGMLQRPGSPRLRIVVVAPRGGGKRTFAASVARALGMRLLLVDADGSDDASWPRLFLRAQRQVFLDTAALAWSGDAVARRVWPANQPLFPIQFVLCEPGTELPRIPGAVDREVRLPQPAAETRAGLWRETSAEAAAWPDDELRKLAERHTVWPGDIVRAGRLGARTPEHAAAVVRESARSRFGSLAQILECPFTSDDLVLPEGAKQLLDAIAFEAEERVSFWQQPEARRLFPQGRGLIALFSGASGTGKTMATQVIAARLGQDLCRVNIAQLVSKWVGETSKNVEQVMRTAAENDVVLFFDEADSLFAKRSTEIRDAQDKFANTDTAYLLQAIENYPGIVILATNLKSNLDSAFVRRLRYLVEFPKPDAALQRTLWTKLVTALAGQTRARQLEPALEGFSTAAEVTGAQIKYAVLTALFAARAEGAPLQPRHLLVGLDRELGKEGRSIGPRERDRILKAGAAAVLAEAGE